MTTFEYLSVFISIVVGLGVVRVLGGIGSILMGRGKGYWVHTAWVAYFGIYLPYFWWATFDWRRADTWTLPVFLFVVFFAMLAYLTTFVLVPEEPADFEDRDAYFFRVRPRFFSLLTLFMVADVVDTLLKPGNVEDVGPTYGPFMTVVIVGNFAAARTDNRRFHEVWIVVSFTALAFAFGVFADVFS